MFILDNEDRRPLYVKLYEQIKHQILSGKLLPNTRLPSVRHLAAELAISRNTVEYTYEQLSMEGFIYSKPQSGYYISSLDQELTPEICKSKMISGEQAYPEGKDYLFDFHPANLSPASFPSKVWRNLLSRCLQEQEQFTVYSNPQGEIELRCEIQRYLERFRGVVCDVEQLVITSGLQDSLSIIAQIIQNHHSLLAVEDPGHWIARSVFKKYASFSLNSIPVTPNGVDLEYLKNSKSTVVYVTPSHQFPLGYVMPVENRLKLINWTKAVGGLIIEDDYDSELRYYGKPIPALQGLNPQGNIIYIGTFSKVLSPALRVSYMVLPKQLLSIYHNMFGHYAASVSLLEQRAILEFMRQGYWERHLRKMRILYKGKHDALIQAIDLHFGKRVKILGQGAGLHMVIELVDTSLDSEELIRRAGEKNVRLFPLNAAYHSQGHYPAQIILGFGKLSPAELEAGIKLLSQAWSL